jgi:hypothetical protein
MISAIWVVVAGSVGLCLGIVLFAVMTMAADKPPQRIPEEHGPEVLV